MHEKNLPRNILFFWVENPRDSADRSRPKLRWGKVLSGRLGSETVSERERKRALTTPPQDRRKGTKGSWVNQGLGPRPGGSWHTQKRVRKSLGLQPNQKWASQTNPNTALLHPWLEAGRALLPLGLYQLRLVSTKICGKWRSPVWWSVCLSTKLFTQYQKGLEISGWPFKRTKTISQINSGDDRNDCVFGKQDQGLALNIFKWTCMLGIVRSKPISGNRS